MVNSRVVFAAIFALLISISLWLILDEGNAGAGPAFAPKPVTVIVEPVASREFADVVEALGTANARESVTIVPRVTDTVEKIYFDDGAVVSDGDLLVALTADEEKADLLEAEGNYSEARRALDRMKDLASRGNVSNAALDAAQRSLNEANARLQAAKARLADQMVRAPFDGILGLRSVSEGSLVSPNTTVTTIDAIDVINLDFQVPERFVAVLGAGQLVEAHVDAYPGETFLGHVKTIDSRVDPATRSIIVRAEVDNQDLRLRPGMLMTVEVTSRTWQSMSVPEESVVPKDGKNYVFVVSGSDVERRAVVLGVRRPGYVEVAEGLKIGDQVVTQGVQRLGRPGMTVRVLDRTTGAVISTDKKSGGRMPAGSIEKAAP